MTTEGERTAELLLSIDTRLQMQGTRLTEHESRFTAMENLLRRIAAALQVERESGPMDTSAQVSNGQPYAAQIVRRKPTPQQMEWDTTIQSVLAQGPLTLTEIARAVYRVERVADTQTSQLHRILQRMIRDGWVVCDARKRYALRSCGEETGI